MIKYTALSLMLRVYFSAGGPDLVHEFIKYQQIKKEITTWPLLEIL